MSMSTTVCRLTKYDPVSLASSSPSLSNDDGHGNNVIILEEDKKLSRNYASYECGAKVITSNPEAQHTSHVSIHFETKNVR